MKVLSVVGARPQLVKLAPVAAALGAAGHEHVIVHTGQHYDPALSEVFFDGLGIPEPDVRLGIGSGSHGEQTGAMLAALEPVLAEHAPDWVLVYGDTNSTLAAALCAVKRHLPLAHLEAGLRSFNRAMPEEHNRVLTDHAADLLLAPTDEAVRHLRDEGLAARTVLVGDVMVDVCRAVRDGVTGAGYRPPLPEGVDPEQPYLLATIHRAENTDDRERLAEVVEALADLPVPVVLPAHPRLVSRSAAHGIELARGAIRLAAPLPYRDLVATVLGSVGVVTDSGGLQKEAFLLGRVCTTLRTETEWPETLADQWNVLVPRPGGSAPRLAVCALRTPPAAPIATPYGDGKAAVRVVMTLADDPAIGSLALT